MPMLNIMNDYGEIVVTCIVLVPILVSLLIHHLLYEFAGLLFLSFAALFVEFVVLNNNSLSLFNPRADTSAGILLGAVCVPIVLGERLVQQRRMASAFPDLNDDEVFISEFRSGLAASFGLLVYILGALNYHKLMVSIKGDKRFWLIFAALVPSLAILLSMELVKVAFLVFVSTWLLHYMVQAFPCCTSLGEAVLVSSGVAVYSSSTVAKGVYKIAAVGPPISQEDTVSAILQGILIGLSCIPWIYKVLSVGFARLLTSSCVHQTKSAERLCNAALFYLAIILAFVTVTTGWLWCVQGLDKFWLIWVVEFLLQDVQRLYLCGYWVCVVSMSVVPFYMVKSTKFEQIMVRKVFHLMVVVMFVPALVIQQAFLHLAFSVALAVFVVIEMIRILRVPPMGEFIHKFMTAFTDTRDSDLLIISHFSLLLGCALPLWLSGSGAHDRPLAPFAGVLSLGIGDTMASVAGYNFGSIRLTRNSKKTLEGTIAGITAMLLACMVICCMHLQSSLTMTEWTSLFVAVICTGLTEAYTTQLDNFILPLIFYTLLLV